MTRATGKADMNEVVSALLRYGVIISTALVGLGAALTFLRPPPSFPSSVGQLAASDFGKPTLDILTLLNGVAAANPSYILQLGLVILLATPVARVIASVILFAAEHDKIYVAITLFVLVVLLVSIFLIGPLEAEAG